MRRMPAGAKMSIASMNAEPMMPNMSVTPLAARVSTKASEGVMSCGPLAVWVGVFSLINCLRLSFDGMPCFECYSAPNEGQGIPSLMGESEMEWNDSFQNTGDRCAAVPVHAAQAG